jgi:NAD(P) transhydrogenase subunit alpha
MRVGVPKESREGERRVALIPDSVGSLSGERLELMVESGAGEAAGHPDSAYSVA